MKITEIKNTIIYVADRWIQSPTYRFHVRLYFTPHTYLYFPLTVYDGYVITGRASGPAPRAPRSGRGRRARGVKRKKKTSSLSRPCAARASRRCRDEAPCTRTRTTRGVGGAELDPAEGCLSVVCELLRLTAICLWLWLCVCARAPRPMLDLGARPGRPGRTLICTVRHRGLGLRRPIVVRCVCVPVFVFIRWSSPVLDQIER